RELQVGTRGVRQSDADVSVAVQSPQAVQALAEAALVNRLIEPVCELDLPRAVAGDVRGGKGEGGGGEGDRRDGRVGVRLPKKWNGQQPTANSQPSSHSVLLVESNPARA